MTNKDLEVKVSIDHYWESCCTGQWCFMYINSVPVLAWEGDVR